MAYRVPMQDLDVKSAKTNGISALLPEQCESAAPV
jgi:hypothetical protein